MKEIVVVSGKGGTGKTTIAAAFAVLAGGCVVADADVDAPDLHLLLHPEDAERGEFVSGYVAVKHDELCVKCGACRNACRFEAIDDDLRISALECEGCGLCALVCPRKAIQMEDSVAGEWFLGRAGIGPMVYGKLKPGKGNSGKLVSLVRSKARSVGQEDGLDLVITDGPPGIGCPVIAAVGAATLAVVVAEPTAAGVHDLERVVGVCRHFRVPTRVVINKADLSAQGAKKIRSFCELASISVVGEIPYDQAVLDSIRFGQPLVTYSRGSAARAVERTWEAVQASLDRRGGPA